MKWTVLTQEQFNTTLWSGGTTTQLAISPADAVYADRDFLWRLSSARVELEHSDFTPLPDYNRLISVLEGGLEMKVDGSDRFPLAPFTVCAFDGGVPVESWGQCTDFNLMLRKGECRGNLQSLQLDAGSSCRWVAAVPGGEEFPNCTLAVYCARGSVTLPEAGVHAEAGQLLLCEDAYSTAVSLASEQGAVLMLSAIYTD